MFDSYFVYYEAELEILKFGLSPLLSPSSNIAATTHDDIVFIVRTLSNDKASTRPFFRNLIHQRWPDANDLALNRSIDLSIRLWLMLNVREGLLTPQTPTIQWDDRSTLRDFVVRQFPRAKWQPTARESRLDPYFTAANMVRICGLKLDWTDSLEDHLRLDRRVKTLRVFRYKFCLSAHLDTSEISSAGGEE